MQSSLINLFTFLVICYLYIRKYLSITLTLIMLFWKNCFILCPPVITIPLKSRCKRLKDLLKNHCGKGRKQRVCSFICMNKHKRSDKRLQRYVFQRKKRVKCVLSVCCLLLLPLFLEGFALSSKADQEPGLSRMISHRILHIQKLLELVRRRARRWKPEFFVWAYVQEPTRALSH